MTRRGVLATILLVLAPVLAATFAVYRPEIPPIARKDLPAPDPGLLRRGAELAGLGDCATCHTAPRGKAFAGGLAIPTPFGTIHSTNVTPDDDTGIGRWSEIAFRRAMREGIDREGRHLYPAFPYDHFTLVSDDDNRALYAYLMTRTAVQAPAQTNALPFPLTVRPLLAGWKLLFLRKGPVASDPLGDAVLNRGPISSRASVIAAPATRRATCSARKDRTRPSPAEMLRAGGPSPSMRPHHRRCHGTKTVSMHICAVAGTGCMA